jgi:hypothetical protein
VSSVVLLPASLAILLAGVPFTNAIEWFDSKLEARTARSPQRSAAEDASER